MKQTCRNCRFHEEMFNGLEKTTRVTCLITFKNVLNHEADESDDCPLWRIKGCHACLNAYERDTCKYNGVALNKIALDEMFGCSEFYNVDGYGLSLADRLEEAVR